MKAKHNQGLSDKLKEAFPHVRKDQDYQPLVNAPSILNTNQAPQLRDS